MLRKPRLYYEGAFYHVIIRGNNKEYINGEQIHCEIDEALKMFSNEKGKAIGQYRQFVMNTDENIKEMKIMNLNLMSFLMKALLLI